MSGTPSPDRPRALYRLIGKAAAARKPPGPVSAMQDEAYASVDGGARRQAICARRKRHSRDGSSPAAKCAESLHEQEEANQQRNRWHGKDPRGRLPASARPLISLIISGLRSTTNAKVGAA